MRYETHECFFDGVDLSEEGHPQVVCACGKKQDMLVIRIELFTRCKTMDLDNIPEQLKEMRRQEVDVFERNDIEQMALESIDHLCVMIEDGADKDKCLDLIYRFAHSACQTTCYNSHKDWREELKKFFHEEFIKQHKEEQYDDGN